MAKTEAVVVCIQILKRPVTWHVAGKGVQSLAMTRSLIDLHQLTVVGLSRVTGLKDSAGFSSHILKVLRMRHRPLDLGSQIRRVTGAKVQAGAAVFDQLGDGA
jgi:hypothetical protein